MEVAAGEKRTWRCDFLLPPPSRGRAGERGRTAATDTLPPYRVIVGIDPGRATGARMRASFGLGLGGFQAVPALISLAREETVDGNILVQFIPMDTPRAEFVVGALVAGRRE